MFSVARYDPTEGGAADKNTKLASLNNRLKRKRTETQDEAPKVNAQVIGSETRETSHQTENRAQNIVALEKVDAEAKKPHREKTKRTKIAEQDVTNESPSRVSHILDRFHKVQQKADTNNNAEAEDVPYADEPKVLADLVPVPQPSHSISRSKHVSHNTGLPAWLQNPVTLMSSSSKAFEDLSLTSRLQDNLKRCEYYRAFAVQAALLPVLLEDHLPEYRKDVLVSAPTGSGKTLTYVLPILQTLQGRRITRLRALVIVPTRELVQQVQFTFETLSSKLGLKIESLSATRPFAAEQNLLINDYEPSATSKVDILICTPGRLVDHLKLTAKFSLADLRFLVIDEGDRLLNQSFQAWSEEVELALKPLHTGTTSLPSFHNLIFARSEERCQKLIFSATMSTEPSLLAQLRLVRPVLYVIRDQEPTEQTQDGDLSRFTTPSSLVEFFVHCPSEVAKPLALLHVISRMDIKRALIFVNSNESAQKLASLLSLMQVGRCEAFTSTLTPQLRRRHLADFTGGANSGIHFLICSDLMARGIDIEVDTVINYDSSIPTRQYVHRAGRTARANKTGQAISIVEKHESSYWWRQIGGKKILRARPITRVTLFPKEDKPVILNPEDQESEIDDSASEAMSHSSESQNPVVSELDQSSTKVAATPQTELLDVDSSALQAIYDDALQSLQSR